MTFESESTSTRISLKRTAMAAPAPMTSVMVVKLGTSYMGVDIEKNILHPSHAAYVSDHGFGGLVALPWNTCPYEVEGFVEFIHNFEKGLECIFFWGARLPFKPELAPKHLLLTRGNG